MSARLDVTGVEVRFGARAALAGVDLHADPGEVVAILGASGSGKTTLLRAVAGLQRLDAGTIRLDGIDLAGLPPHRRGVGLMFQDQTLFPHRDVAGNVAFGLRMQGRSRPDIEGRVAELLELVGLPDAGRRAVTTLSGGEQQRVALARALAPEPRLLLLDEPLGALDRGLRDRLVAELHALFHRLGLTVVAVTHDQTEAFALADRIAVVDEGRVLQSGPPAEVWDQPVSARVARLLGFGNVVRATVRDGRLTTPWGEVATNAAAADSSVEVLVRPAGVHLGSSGPVAGRVTSAAFAGSHVRLTIAVDGAPPLEAHVPATGAPMDGDVVQVTIDPTAVTVL